MTHLELQAWRERMGLSHKQGAHALLMSLQGFRDALYGCQPISKRTAFIAEAVERQHQQEHQPEEETTE